MGSIDDQFRVCGTWLRALRLLAHERHEVGEGVVTVLVVLCQRRRAVRSTVHSRGGRRGAGGGADDWAVVGGGVGQGRVLVRQTCSGNT